MGRAWGGMGGGGRGAAMHDTISKTQARHEHMMTLTRLCMLKIRPSKFKFLASKAKKTHPTQHKHNTHKSMYHAKRKPRLSRPESVPILFPCFVSFISHCCIAIAHLSLSQLSLHHSTQRPPWDDTIRYCTYIIAVQGLSV